MFLMFKILDHFVSELTHLYEQTVDRCHGAEDQASLACHLLSSYGVGHDDLRQFSPRLSTSAIRRLRETKILTTCMFDLQGERTDISLKEIEAIKNKKIKKTYMRSATKLLLDAQLRLREAAERAGVSLIWAAASVVRFGNPIDHVQKQLDRIHRLRNEKQLFNPTGFFIETMEQSREVLLSDFNDPDLKHDRSPLHHLHFLQEGQVLLRKLSALRRDYPEEFIVQQLIVSDDGEVVGARSERGEELTLSELKTNYGLLEAQTPQEPQPNPYDNSPGLSPEALRNLIEKLQKGRPLSTLDQMCIKGTGYTGEISDHPQVLMHLQSKHTPSKAQTAPEKPSKALPRVPLTPAQREGIIVKLEAGKALSTADTILLTLAGFSTKNTAPERQHLLEMLRLGHGFDPLVADQAGFAQLGW